MNFGYALKCRQTYALNYFSVGFGSSESLETVFERCFRIISSEVELLWEIKFKLKCAEIAKLTSSYDILTPSSNVQLYVFI